jgi:hypothetical protein
MLKWLHHLFNPHCVECDREKEMWDVCPSCETVKMQLAIANAEKRQLLETILALTKPAEVQQHVPNEVKLENVSTKGLLWNVRRQMLEAEDKIKAEVIRKERATAEEIRKAAVTNPTPEPSPKVVNIDDRSQSIEQLEKELGITQETGTNA